MVGDNTKIEWTDATWNPVTGCSPMSAGCKNCYAARMAKRLAGRYGYDKDDPFKVTVHKDRMRQPSHWRKPRRIFVCSMGDLFHPGVPDEVIFSVLNKALAGNRRHIYIVLTKRPERMKRWFARHSKRFWHYTPPDEPRPPYVLPYWPDSQLWLGVTVENRQTALRRIPVLMSIAAAVRFISVEPMLGPVIPPIGINWVICGAETGPGARPMELGWARELRDRCHYYGIPFFMKQVSGKGPIPEDLMIREWPTPSR